MEQEIFSIINQPLTVLLITVFIVLTAKYYFDRRRTFLLGRKLPGPIGWPFIGNALVFSKCDYDILPVVNEFHKIYDLFALYTCHQLNVFVKSVEDCEIYCKSYKLIHRGEKLEFFHSLLGKGLAFAGGDEWKKAKKVMGSAFPLETLRTHYLTAIKNETKALMQRLANKEGKETFLMYPYLRDCTFDIICNGVFDLEINAQEGNVEIVDAIEENKSAVIKRVFSPWLKPDFLFKLSKAGKVHFQTWNMFRQSFNLFYEKNQKEFEKEYLTGLGEETNNNELFYKQLLRNKNLNKEEMEHHFLNVIVTGFESTANVCSFVLAMLGIHQDVQERVYNELILKIPDGDFDFEKLQELEYLKRVINETLRLFPAVPLNSRKCTEDIQFGQYLIPAGSDVHLNIFALHRDPKHFSKPNEFNPDNFLPENVLNRHPYAYVPFSAGPRKCIGLTLAMMILKVMVTAIIISYKVECDYKNLEEIPIYNDVNLRMSDNCPLRLLKRDKGILSDKSKRF